LIHADETKVSLKGRTGYVWVFTNLEEVAYIYSDTREGTILEEMLKNFGGVLVSDFYAAYDSPDCVQQKCLIHLIRDVNDDLFKNPFDEELKTLAADFTDLLVPIIETVDKYGLKKRHLNKHRVDVRRFFTRVSGKKFLSEIAQGYQRRLGKYEDKLFAFLKYDGVPWNNNNAENAVKRFAFLRRVIGGSSTEEGIKELGLDQFGGCFADRDIRGGDRKSTHAWAIAFDFDPSHNTLHMKAPIARFSKPEYEAWWQAWEAEGWYSLGRHKDYDWMHVQACWRD